MEGTTTPPASHMPLRQRIVAAIATITFILAMLLGGGAPHDVKGNPTPTPVVAPAP